MGIVDINIVNINIANLNKIDKELYEFNYLITK